MKRADVHARLGLCVLSALLMWAFTGGWAPPLAYRTGYIPPRDIIARTEFTRVDPQRTAARRRQARSETLMYYVQEPRSLDELRILLRDMVFQVTRADSFEKLDREIWNDFLGDQDRSLEQQRRLFKLFRDALDEDLDLTRFDESVRRALESYQQYGVLERLEHGPEQGSQTAIRVHPPDYPEAAERVDVTDVRLGSLEQKLLDEFKAGSYSEEQVQVLSQVTGAWLRPQMPITLRFNQDASRAASEKAMAQVEPVRITYYAGSSELAEAGAPLEAEDIALLRAEHEALLGKLRWPRLVAYSLASLGMFVALYVLCGVYIYFRHRSLLRNTGRLAGLLALVTAAVALCTVASFDAWRAEVTPLVLLGIIGSIIYQEELALLLSAAAALIVSLALGLGLAEFVILVASAAAAILLLGRIRSRTKLIYVGAGAGAVALLTAVGVGVLTGQVFGVSQLVVVSADATVDPLDSNSFVANLLAGAAWYGLCGLMAGVLMTGLLPFVERAFDVQTDLSLLELGDVAHPLLQELVRRAPGTYNHSINVASIGDAAAEAIGANGLLVRVGGYFHDIGKMLKPGYFVENQGESGNRHDSLMPAMSTLVIIAHVKDGADLARQYGLPRSIIDFIEQHHGTTLVEYFYRQAAARNENDPDGGVVDETAFRYPGPKPQSKETAVLMLADAVESASRALSDPTPARIEGLVEDIAMKRLLDGQFDQCGLTLRELAIVEDSLVKSLTAVYHGRVKYPSQQTA